TMTHRPGICCRPWRALARMPIDRSKLPTLSIGDDSNRGLSREGTRTTAHARARRRITQMLSREPPRSTVGYLHGERNTPKFRFKDPRNAKRERQNRAKPGKEQSGRTMLDAGVHQPRSRRQCAPQGLDVMGGAMSGGRQGEEERGTLVRLRLHPDPAAVAFDDLPADRKPDPGSRILVSRVQPAERFEDPLREAGTDPDPVVPHPQAPVRPSSFRPDVDDRQFPPVEFHRVADQVLEDLRESDSISAHERQLVVGDDDVTLADRRSEICQRRRENLLAADHVGRYLLRTRARV